MLHIDSFLAEGWATWRRAELRFTPGVTFFRGLNRDANGTANFAGKSTLFNAMYALTQSEHPQASKKRSMSSVLRSETRLALSAHYDDGRPLRLELRGGKTTITTGATKTHVSRKTVSREEVAELVNIPPELWSATVHVSSVDSSPILRKTGAERCRFLEQAFDLTGSERKHAFVSERVSAIRGTTKELAALNDELRRLPENDSPDDVRGAVADLTKSVAGLEKRLAEAEQRLARFESAPPRPTKSADELRSIVKRARRALDSAQARHDAAERTAAVRAEWDAYRSRRRELVRDARVRTPSPRQIEDLLARDREHLEYAEAYESDARSADAWLRAAKRIAQRHSVAYVSVRQLYSLSLGWASALRPGQNSCPVCGGKMSGRVDRADLDALKDALDGLSDSFDPMREKPRRSASEVRREVERLERALVVAEDAYEARRALADLREPSAPCPERVESRVDVSRVAQILGRAEQALAAAEFWDEAGRRVDVTALRESVAHSRKKYREASQALADLRATLRELERTASRREELRAKIATLTRELQLEPVYKALHLAYSPSGIRLQRLSEALEELVANLNASASFTRDAQTYSYKLSRNRDLSIMASNRHATYDIRYLSGAESRLFTINLLLTLLPMLPSHKRTSLLVLDELEANMDAETRGVFTEELIPKLAAVVPSLVIVTPLTQREFNYRGARQLMAVKHDSVSELRSL